MSPRNRILGYIRHATASRPRLAHPGRFDARFLVADDRPPVERFAEMFAAAGGEVERLASDEHAARWLADFARAFDCASVGATVPSRLRPRIPSAAPDLATLAVSLASGAIAETGSLVLDARDGRRTQILAPTHVVFVRERDVHPTAVQALVRLGSDLPSAVGLHSGPSKSADIDQILVRGVHGPARIVAAIIAS